MTCTSCRGAIPPDALTCPRCDAPAPTAHPPERATTAPPRADDKSSSGGDVISGRFVLRQELGRGGMGVVYRAYDRELRVDVAIKLLPSVTRDDNDVERLRREILAARRVTHRNVIRINEFGLGGRDAFIAMEYLTGGTLAGLLEKGPLPIARAVEISIGLAEGLAAAHEVGVVHRDIKSENVLFDDAGTPKLADFGLARLNEATKLTVGFSGTPSYMSPEQGEGKTVTEKSDVYSFGVLLYEMFTGELPFKADSLVRMAMLHATQPPAPLRSIREDVPPELEGLVLSAMEKDPAKRPSATEFLGRLHEIADGLGDLVRRPTLRRTYRRVTAPRPRVSRALLAIAALLLLGGVTVWRLVPRGADAPPTTPLPVAAATSNATPEPVVSPPPVTPPPPIPTQTATKATPKTTKISKATPTSTSTPSAVVAPPKSGRLSVTSFPSIEVWVDGKRIAKETPLRKQVLPAGDHVLRFENPALNFTLEYRAKIPADGDLTLHVDAEKGEVRVR